MPGVDSRAPDQGRRPSCCRDPTRRLFLRGGREPRRARAAHRLRHHRRRSAQRGAARHVALERRRAGALFSPNRLAPEFPESAITRPFPFNAYYGEDEAPRGRRGRLQARDRRPGRQQEVVDAARALRAAAGFADHAPHLRRGLERDRQMERRAAFATFLQRIGADTDREVRRLQVRRRLLHQHRHADRAASADAAHVQASPTRSCRASTASR